MSNRSLRFWFVAIAIVAVSVASYFLPAVPSLEHQYAQHWQMALTVVMTASFCGSALLFLTGLTAFKAELRRAYRWFAAGMILFGLSLIQLPVLLLLGPRYNFWSSSGLVVVPFICSTLFMYIGMRRFARLLSVHSLGTSWLLSTGAVIIASIISAFASNFFAATPGIATASYTATVAWGTGYGLLAWLLALKIRRLIGETYRRPMGWLALALGMMTFSGLHSYTASFFLSQQNDWYVYTGASLWPFIASGLAFLRASYFFSPEQTTGPAAAVPAGEESKMFIDSIVTVASMSSRPQDIDAILDNFRVLTLSLQPGTPMTSVQREKLVTIYLKVEAYLTTNDPLRTFTVQELRSKIAAGFRQYLEQNHTSGQPTIIAQKV